MKTCKLCKQDKSETEFHKNRSKKDGLRTECKTCRMQPRKTPEQRFWERIDKRSVNECWEWMGRKEKEGYGIFTINGKRMATHRYSYELHNGSIDKKLDVLHKCDNPACCNFLHLFQGTHIDNMKDMISKNRHAIGEKIWSTKLTESEVIEIRERLQNKIPERTIAQEFGVSRGAISCIKRNDTWKYVK